MRLSLSVRHVARLLLPVLHLGDPAAELDRPLRLPGCRRQAEIVRSQSDQDELYQRDFKTGVKDGTYDFLYAQGVCILLCPDSDSKVFSSVPHPWHFGTDPYPRLRTSD